MVAPFASPLGVPVLAFVSRAAPFVMFASLQSNSSAGSVSDETDPESDDPEASLFASLGFNTSKTKAKANEASAGTHQPYAGVVPRHGGAAVRCVSSPLCQLSLSETVISACTLPPRP